MLNGLKLKRINDRPKKARLFPLLAIGAGSLALAAVLVALTSSLWLAPAVLLAGGAGVLVAYRAQRASTITTLAYEGNLSGEVAVRFSAISEACEVLSSSEKIWCLSGGAGREKGAADIAPPPDRTPARVGLLETPGIRADVPIWGIDDGDKKIFFFPEGVLIYEGERYVDVSYKALKVAFSLARFFEEETVPEDAEVVGHARRHARESGSYYRHYGPNPRVPVVLYGLLEITFPNKVEVRLQVSNLDAGARFARMFGAWEAEKPHEERTRRSAYAPPPVEERAEVVSARKVLGVRDGASMSEIVTAYRKMARLYHPDKVLDLPAEVREFSERRMKEINDADTELKHHGRNPTDARVE